MSGRRSKGPELVENLEGSEHAKERLEIILATLSGELTVSDACERLGNKAAMFYRLRTRVLQAGLSDLEPRPRGRPRHELSPEQAENERLAREVVQLEEELKIAEVRREIQEILPGVKLAEEPPRSQLQRRPDTAGSAGKKTTQRDASRRRKKRQRQDKRRQRRKG